MPDDIDKTKPIDSTRVNINEEYEMQYWTQRLKCTRMELEQAVKAVGDSSSRVEDYLKKYKR